MINKMHAYSNQYSLNKVRIVNVNTLHFRCSYFKGFMRFPFCFPLPPISLDLLLYLSKVMGNTNQNILISIY